MTTPMTKSEKAAAQNEQAARDARAAALESAPLVQRMGETDAAFDARVAAFDEDVPPVAPAMSCEDQCKILESVVRRIAFSGGPGPVNASYPDATAAHLCRAALEACEDKTQVAENARLKARVSHLESRLRDIEGGTEKFAASKAREALAPPPAPATV